MKSIALYYNEAPFQEGRVGQSDEDAVESYGVIENKALKASAKESQECINNQPKTGGTTNQTELHLNIWKVEEGRVKLTPRFYIDFGIMFPKSYKQLCLYLPFEIEEVTRDRSLVT